MAGASLLLVPMLLWRGRIGRPMAGLLLLGYGVYLVILF
jgi:hypothetical protein